MKPIQLLLLFFCIFFFAGCQKEPEATGLPPQNGACKPVKGWSYFTNGVLSDSIRYEYANDRLVKIHYNDDEVITYDYSGDNVVKRSVFEIGQSSPYTYQTFSYNASGGLEKTILVYEDFFGAVSDSAAFVYSGGKMTSAIAFSKSSITAGAYERQADYNFTYTGNNISKVVINTYIDGALDGTETVLLSFDKQPNYFRKQTPQFFQTDPFFLEADFLYLAFVLSENNVIKMADADTPADTSEIEYLADSKGNFTEMKVDGFTALRYAYECK